ncbi:hypothetical protein, partial [Taklimakanibacter deserti]|uniref:hypothetical protein n=1 Tax=Taklimakanibacter deserti TaxID=2267839 RepID=UPI0034D4D7E8
MTKTGLPLHDHIPLFDRNDHPFVPTYFKAERRAQVLSRMPPKAAPAKLARSVLDSASTALQSTITEPSRP